MEINNVLVYTEQHKFVRGSIELDNGIIRKIALAGEDGDNGDNDVLYAIPGLVDIHFHGCMGADLCDAEPDTIRTLAEYEAGQGVTTICPATMTMPVAELRKIMANIGAYRGDTGAHFAGVNMEGPFISAANKGAQAADNIIPCDVELFRELNKLSGDRIRLVDIAPEEPGAMEFIEAVRDEVVVSLAHTGADYDTAMEAFQKGANHVTHMFNGMQPFHHRNPGVQGAAADAAAYVELICDGVHIHPAMVRAVFRLFGSGRVCLISDSMRAAGLADGEYTLGGQAVTVRGKRAVLANGSLAGSVTNLMNCLRTVVLEMGIPLEQAVQSATETPARSVGLFDRCGSIAPGKQADIVLLDRELKIRQVFVGGRAIVQ
ncbi:N-acetylglucosamine-6-phosphate deacetylase [Anaerovibrio sp.]|uniref:N-acetylglucosamine-6-phosphate deacetylase n=1 Tax=Anaerovibrio sp. TaxID=1872532 RepID=UPI003F14EBE7